MIIAAKHYHFDSLQSSVTNALASVAHPQKHKKTIFFQTDVTPSAFSGLFKVP